ncbi:MAG: DUF924 family protein [Paracoccaceae bacterium]
METVESVLEFWLSEIGPDGWYKADDVVDDAIRARFLSDWQAAHDGKREGWRADARGALAYLILTDQFPRNMFRGDPRSFETDARARAATEEAIAHGWDMAIAEPERQFFYMPLMHSERMADQDRCVALIESSMPETGPAHLTHARAHREVILRFGRFPFRNDALGRETTAEEAGFLAEGGYGSIVRGLENKR